MVVADAMSRSAARTRGAGVRLADPCLQLMLMLMLMVGWVGARVVDLERH